MDAAFREALDALSTDPVLQGLLTIVGTFILEDAALLICGLLVADSQMRYDTALVALALGIALGDWGLYFIGRVLGPRVVTWGLVSGRRLERMRAWFEENMFSAILVSRFVPGLRLPANLAVGMAHASLRRYMPAALFASWIWTLIALTLIVWLGAATMPLLGALKWPVGLALVGVLILVQRRSFKRMAEEPETSSAEGAPASAFEFWHPWIFYAPVAAYYAWLALRYRSLTLPTAANPSIYSGGMIRESKSQILGLVPEHLRSWVAAHASYEFARGASSRQHAEQALVAIEDAGISLPIVAKPDQGQRGAGVHPVRSIEELSAYFDRMPRGIRVVLQELVPDPHEIGLMYYRLPSEARGRIVSVTLKEFPFVTGDGVRTLRQLIEADPRARLMAEVFFARHTAVLDQIVPAGERFALVFAGNHAQGCVFRDGLHVLTPSLAARIDEIARALPEFYFGRFDIRFRDLESLQRGDAFKIVEINGAGAEATHIWDPEARLGDAYRTLFAQFEVLFAIGDANRRAGRAPLGPLRFLWDVLLYRRLSRKYPIAG